MRQWIVDSWNAVMDVRYNPLRHIPDIVVRHLVLQALAWMWCAAFATMIGDFFFFGWSVLAHAALVAAITITVATFEVSKRKPNAFNFIKGYHSYGRGRPGSTGYYWSNGKRLQLPKGDPGGEHE